MVKEKKKAPAAAAKGDDGMLLIVIMSYGALWRIMHNLLFSQLNKWSSITSARRTGHIVLPFYDYLNLHLLKADVFNNLHGAVSKTVMQKVLNSLTEHESISSKTYNKQTVYVDQFETPSENELSEMDQKIETLKAAAVELKDTNKQLQSTLSGLNQSLTKEQIGERLKVLNSENAKYEERLTTLRSGTKQISVDEKKKIDNEYEANRMLWKKRKRMFNEIFGTITENMQQNPKEFAEEIGIEQDIVDINVDPLANL
ncbi:Tat binding protein 1-interacting protein-domain-containing protein [Endogone sp. FLAS-F59071]|nr:Tat binding protein 1-interacting protein-domain-containing protein [Endogone sp. FLAS-F59071]|eukprot:RUS23370.1 Tat binding protein 1-interacting protein-domain-containing protein [Endogone sp. FLAS-F59071]